MTETQNLTIDLPDLPEVGEPSKIPVIRFNPPPPTPADTMLRVIEAVAMNPQADVAKLDHLLAVRERWEASEQRKAFVAAMAAFKAEPLVIEKNKRVKYGAGDAGGKVDFYHATLGNVVEVIGPALGKHGLAHRWEVQQDPKGMISVTCVLMHCAGHEERVTLVGLPDASGKKNAIQQTGSTITYLQRYTLMAATGMASQDQDDDGAGGAEPVAPTLDSARSIEIKKAIEATTVMSELREFWITLTAEEQAAMTPVKEAQRKKLMMPQRKSEAS